MTTINAQTDRQSGQVQWVQLGLIAAVIAVAAVLLVQMIAIAIWPDIALFKPLDSYVRTAIFVLVPAAAATALFAWLARRKTDPVPTFLMISGVVLVLSIIPDYLLPVEYKTFLASSVTAFMHLVAAVIIVATLVVGYRRQSGA